MSPGDSLAIDFSSETPFSGKGEIVNLHLRALRGVINANRKYINGIDFYNQSVARVDAILDSLQSVYLDAHREFQQDHPGDDQQR